jgi:hypothetical protein
MPPPFDSAAHYLAIAKDNKLALDIRRKAYERYEIICWADSLEDNSIRVDTVPKEYKTEVVAEVERRRAIKSKNVIPGHWAPKFPKEGGPQQP